jgi:hypothetical protein
VADIVVEREFVARRAEILAELLNLGSGNDGLESLDDHTARRQEARGAALQEGEIEIDKGFGIAGERLEIEERGGVDDDAAGGLFLWLEEIFRAGAEEEFVGEDS